MAPFFSYDSTIYLLFRTFTAVENQFVTDQHRMSKFTQIIIIGLLAFVVHLNSLSAQIKLSPENWWTGHAYNKIVVMAQGQQIGANTASIKYPGVTLVRTIPGESPNYLFLELEISPSAQPGAVPIHFNTGSRSGTTINFSLAKKNSVYSPKGLNQADAIYEIAPDRFSDGNPDINNLRHYYERTDRLNPAGVHGGDLAGIKNHLDYIQELGFTTLHLLPVAESNQMISSYHRMGATDFYRIDERLGSTNDYKSLIDQCHQKNMKVVQSMVLHQVGKQHPLFKEAPFANWFYPPRTDYVEELDYTSLTDRYATPSDFNSAIEQWEEMDLPVLNQTNEWLARYLIQHTIWWVETYALDGIQLEKTPRNHPSFIRKWLAALHATYPHLAILTDVPTASSANAAYWQNLMAPENNKAIHQIHSNDYSLAYKTADAFSTFREANEGMLDLYNTLAADYTYQNPKNNIVFIDNHQLTRAYTNADKELNQLKMMMGFIMTTRGIPSMLYGTELLLDGNISKGEGFVRKDFPGGWAGDLQNGFTQKGLSAAQKEFSTFIKRLVSWRKTAAILNTGEFKHYKPADGIYVYGKTGEKNGVMVIINNSDANKWRLDLSKYQDMLKHFTSATDILTGNTFDDLDDLLVLPKSILIFDLK